MPTIPLKDYLYVGAILVLLIGFFSWNHHERSIQKVKDAAVDAKAVAAQVERNTALLAVATLATSTAQGDYDHATSIPIVPIALPASVCHSARGPGLVPAAAGPDRGGDTEAELRAENTRLLADLQQVADSDAATGRDADAQVETLQKIVAALRSEMENSNVKR